MRVTVRIENRIFEVEVGDVSGRPIVATIDGERFEVWPESTGGRPPPGARGQANQRMATDRQMAAPVQPATPAPTNGSESKTVRAPIPGVIISIAVQPGDAVAVGQELCVLEAMKMKNAIRASRAGQIASVKVSIGQAVKHHDVLLEFSG
jgi:biotin carboxyl carrier protein